MVVVARCRVLTIGLCLAVCLMLWPLAGQAQDALLLPYTIAESVEKVGPGLEHFVITTSRPAQRQAIHVLRMELRNPYTYIRSALGQGTVAGAETVTRQMARLGAAAPAAAVVAGVNGDFFLFSPVAGVPFGLHIEDNELVLSPNAWPSFGVTAEGAPFIDYARWEGKAVLYAADGTERGSIRLTAINRVRGPYDTVLYTPRFGPATRTSAEGIEVVLSGLSGPLVANQVYQCQAQEVRAAAGNAAIAAGSLVLSVAGAGRALAQSIAVGDRIDLAITLAAPFERARHAISGNLLLVQDGRMALAAADAANSERHPRTAVGYNDRYIFLVTVDGRQPGYADGMTYRELAELCLNLGVQAAINLDGGGSTTFAVRPAAEWTVSVRNRPSDGAERAVGNSLQVVSTAPPGRLTRIWAAPAQVTAPVGASVQIAVKGQDEWGSPVRFAAGELLWSVSGDVGIVDATGRFTALAPGDGIITVAAGPAAQPLISAVPVTVVAPPAEEPEPAGWLDGFEDLAHWRIAVARASATLSLATPPEPVYAGHHAVKLTYDLAAGPEGTAAAYVEAPQRITIAELPARLGLWVYGDGQGHWLRGSYLDSAGTRHNINFTLMRGLTWVGWRYVEAEVDPSSIPPLQFERIYVTETDQDRRGSGTLYFDDLRAVYTSELARKGE